MSESKKFWIGGYHSVLSAIKNPHRKINQIITSSKEKFGTIPKTKCEVNLVNQKKIDDIFKNYDFNHQNIAAEIYDFKKKKIQEIFDLSQKTNVIILDNLTDQRNIGSIIRTAVAFDIKNIIIKERIFNPHSPYVYKISAGALEYINIISVVNLSNSIGLLKKNDFWIYGFDGKANKTIKNNSIDNNQNFCLIFGSEDKGISQNLLKKCDEIYKIKISNNIESLNVSNAVSAALAIINS